MKVTLGQPHWSVLVDWQQVIAIADNPELQALGLQYLVPEWLRGTFDADPWARRMLTLWAAFQCGVGQNRTHVLFACEDGALNLYCDGESSGQEESAARSFVVDVVLVMNGMRCRRRSSLYKFRWHNLRRPSGAETTLAQGLSRRVAEVVHGDPFAYEAGRPITDGAEG